MSNRHNPEYIFIVPYRDREEHLYFFKHYIKTLLEDFYPYQTKIIYVHQSDNLPFNCGAMKNFGFKYIKELYPNDYKNMIFIFNDVDTLPYKKNLLNYKVSKGEIKHFYGHTFALGGIFSILGGDFEKLNGFPNYWGWGFEDNVIYQRVVAQDMLINRSQFYGVRSREILHFYDDYQKKLDTNVAFKQSMKHYIEKNGLDSLKNYKYLFESTTNMLHIQYFNCGFDSRYFKPQYHKVNDGTKIKVNNKSSLMMMKFK